MSDPIYVYAGTYPSKDSAKADLNTVRALYAADVLRTYDAAVVSKDADGKVHVHRYEETTTTAAWGGAAIGALVGLLFPPAFIATTVVGATAGGLGGHLWRGLSRGDLKDLGELLDAGEASLVVITTTEFDHAFASALKATAHQIKKLEKADAKAFAQEAASLAES